MKHEPKFLMSRFALMSFLLFLTMFSLWVGNLAASPGPTSKKPDVIPLRIAEPIKGNASNNNKSDLTPARVSAQGNAALTKAQNSALAMTQVSALAMMPRMTAPNHIGVAGRASASARLSGTTAQTIVTPGANALFLPSDPPADDDGYTPAVNAFNSDSTTSGCSDSDLEDTQSLTRVNPEWKPIRSLNTDHAADQHIFGNEPVILEGRIAPRTGIGTNDQSSSEVSEEEIPWNHFTHDFTVKVTPDPPYKRLLSSWERFQGATIPFDKLGTDVVTACLILHGTLDFQNGVCKIPEDKCDDGSTTTARCHHTEMEVEWDNASLMDESEGFQRIWGAAPEFVWPGGGDRIWVMGRWIFDCGHPGVPEQAVQDRFVKYSTEIHPPRAMVTFRLNHPALDSFPTPRVSAPNFPFPQSYLPVTGFPPTFPGGGPTNVPVTEADIYITGNGGGANDLCMIRASNSDNDCKVPHTLQVEPVNDRNYVFDIYPPGTDYAALEDSGAFKVSPPVPDASLQWRIEDHFSELPAHTCGGLDNTSCVTVDPIFCLVDKDTAPPLQTDTTCPAVNGPPTHLRVILPFAGSSANFFARSILLGWDDVPNPSVSPTIRTFRIKLHSFQVVSNGFIQPNPPSGPLRADWRVFVNIGGQYRYISRIFDRDADGKNKCFGDRGLNSVAPPECFFFDNTPWVVSVLDGTTIHVGVGGFRSDGIDDDFCRKFLTPDTFDGADKCEPFGTDDVLELALSNDTRIGDYEFDLDSAHNYQWVDSDGNPLTSFQTVRNNDRAQYKVMFQVEELPANNPPPSSPIQIGTPHFGNFVSSTTPIVLSSPSSATAGFQYRSYAVGGPLPVYPFSPPQPYPVHWTSADFAVGAQSVPVFITGTDGPNLLQYSARSVANLLEPRHTETLILDNTLPVIDIVQPQPTTYTHSATLTLNYSESDGTGSGIGTVTPTMDGATSLPGGVGLQSGQPIRLLKELSLGTHTFRVSASDNVNNTAAVSVSFTIVVTAASIIDDVNQLLQDGAIRNNGLANSLLVKLNHAADDRAAGRCSQAAQRYQTFIQELHAQSGNGVDADAAAIMIADAQFLIAHCP